METQNPHVRRLELRSLLGDIASLASAPTDADQVSAIPATDTAVSQALQVLIAAQHLTLQRRTSSAVEPSERAESNASDLEGSTEHLLGITPAVLLATSDSQLVTAKAEVQEWLPELSALLEQRHQWLADACDCSGAPEQLPAAVLQLVKAARKAEDEQEAAEERYVAAAEQLLDAHEQLQAAAAAAAEAYQEAVHAHKEQDAADFEAARQEHELSQLSLLTLQASMLADTYTPEAVAALEQAAQELQAAETQAADQIAEVGDQISQRRALGWEYADLVERHGHNLQVIEDITAGMA